MVTPLLKRRQAEGVVTDKCQILPSFQELLEIISFFPLLFITFIHCSPAFVHVVLYNPGSPLQ